MNAPAADGAALSFRFAEDADIPDVVVLVNAAFRGDSGRRGWTTEADLVDGRRTDAEMLAETLARPAGGILLAERDGRLLGCAYLRRRGSGAYFGLFSIRPAAQGAGLGSVVLAEAERHAAREWGCTRMELSVLSPRAELLAWYARRGYTPTGHVEPFPYGDSRYGIPLRDGLEFTELSKDLG